jgi:hypothetical protein
MWESKREWKENKPTLGPGKQCYNEPYKNCAPYEVAGASFFLWTTYKTRRAMHNSWGILKEYPDSCRSCLERRQSSISHACHSLVIKPRLIVYSALLENANVKLLIYKHLFPAWVKSRPHLCTTYS